MTVQDVSHVELYAKDKVPVVQHLVSALGFTRVADSVEADRSSVLLRQGRVQLVVTSGRGTWGFLSEHGDGVADIAMACEDVAATRDAAAAAGARVRYSPQGNPVVPGFGAVRHTLLPATAGGALALPAGRRWIATPGAPTEPAGRIRRLDHLSIRLAADGIGDYAAFCERVFGFSRDCAERLGLGGRATGSVAVASTSERAALVLAESDGRDGPGVRSLAFLVDDIRSAPRGFEEPGAVHPVVGPDVRGVLSFRFVERRGLLGPRFGDAGVLVRTLAPEPDRLISC